MIKFIKSKEQIFVSVLHTLFFVVLDHITELDDNSGIVRVVGIACKLICVSWQGKEQGLESHDLLVLHFDQLLKHGLVLLNLVEQADAQFLVMFIDKGGCCFY